MYNQEQVVFVYDLYTDICSNRQLKTEYNIGITS